MAFIKVDPEAGWGIVNTVTAIRRAGCAHWASLAATLEKSCSLSQSQFRYLRNAGVGWLGSEGP